MSPRQGRSVLTSEQKVLDVRRSQEVHVGLTTQLATVFTLQRNSGRRWGG